MNKVKSNILTKDGLTGNNGFNVLNLPFIAHVSASYAAMNGNVFIETGEDNVPEWERVTLEQAIKQKSKIITCSYCQNPAISLDHFWPYHSEMNYCADHKQTAKDFVKNGGE